MHVLLWLFLCTGFCHFCIVLKCILWDSNLFTVFIFESIYRITKLLQNHQTLCVQIIRHIPASLYFFVACNSSYVAPGISFFPAEDYCWQETPRIVLAMYFPFHSQCGKTHQVPIYILHSSKFHLDHTEHLFLGNKTMRVTPNTLLHLDSGFPTALRDTNSLKID